MKEAETTLLYTGHHEGVSAMDKACLTGKSKRSERRGRLVFKKGKGREGELLSGKPAESLPVKGRGGGEVWWLRPDHRKKENGKQRLAGQLGL